MIIATFLSQTFLLFNLKNHILHTCKNRCLSYPGKTKSLIKDYALSVYDAEILTREKSTADFFEEACKIASTLASKKEKTVDAKSIANWIINKKIDTTSLLPAHCIEMILQQTAVVSLITMNLML